MREFKKGSLGMLVLHLLYQQPSYGWELCERLRTRSDAELQFEDSAVYPLLHTYERHGLVEGYWEEDAPDAPRTGPRRRYYRLTPQGIAALRTHLQEWQTFTSAVNHILTDPAIASGEGQS